MIERYTLPEMGALWSEQNKFQKWLDVEIAVCEVHAEMGTIPRDALEQIKRNKSDVIVCDQRMPGVSGQRLYRIVESLNSELRHRFLFVTGDVVNAQTKRFFEQAGVQYLRKPFRIQELVEAIEGLVNLVNRSQPLNS